MLNFIVFSEKMEFLCDIVAQVYWSNVYGQSVGVSPSAPPPPPEGRNKLLEICCLLLFHVKYQFWACFKRVTKIVKNRTERGFSLHKILEIIRICVFVSKNSKLNNEFSLFWSLSSKNPAFTSEQEPPYRERLQKGVERNPRVVLVQGKLFAPTPPPPIHPKKSFNAHWNSKTRRKV